jgi:hypothetical protein
MAVTMTLLLSMGACADAGGPSGGVVALRLLPQEPTVAQTDSLEFVAFGVTAAGDTVALDVTWSAEGGEITGRGEGKGVYKPRGKGRDMVKARADTLADSTMVTVLPAAPAITSPSQGATLTTATPTIAGTAEPNVSVEVLVDMGQVRTVTAGGGGSWLYTLTADQALADGAHTTSVVAISAGDRSPASPTINFTVAVPDTTVDPPADDDPHYVQSGDGQPLFLLGFGHPLDWYHPTKYAEMQSIYTTYNLSYARIFLPWAGPASSLVAYTHQRTGPGTATDGGLNFDLTRIDTSFLDRLENMVSWASDNNIVVAVSLWHDWPFEDDGGQGYYGWSGSVMNSANNVNPQTADIEKAGPSPYPWFWDCLGLNIGCIGRSCWSDPADGEWVRERVKDLYDEVLRRLSPYSNWYIELGNRAYFYQNAKRYWANYLRGVPHALDDGAVSAYALPNILLIDQPWEPSSGDPTFQTDPNDPSSGSDVVQQYTIPELDASTQSTGLAVNERFTESRHWGGEFRTLYNMNLVLLGTAEGQVIRPSTHTGLRRAAWQALLGGGHWEATDDQARDFGTTPANVSFLPEYGHLMTFVRAARNGTTIERRLVHMQPDNSRIVSTRNAATGPFALVHKTGQTEGYLVFANAGTNPTVTVGSAGLTITRLDAVTGLEDTDPGSPTTAGTNVLTGTGNDTAWWITSAASGTGGR